MTKVPHNELKGMRLYLCYPFYSGLPSEDFRNVMLALYSVGITPIIAATYLVQQNHHLLDRHNIYSTIALCDGIIICREEHLTRNMTAELLYAKKISLTVYKLEP